MGKARNSSRSTLPCHRCNARGRPPGPMHEGQGGGVGRVSRQRSQCAMCGTAAWGAMRMRSCRLGSRWLGSTGAQQQEQGQSPCSCAGGLHTQHSSASATRTAFLRKRSARHTHHAHSVRTIMRTSVLAHNNPIPVQALASCIACKITYGPWPPGHPPHTPLSRMHPYSSAGVTSTWQLAQCAVAHEHALLVLLRDRASRGLVAAACRPALLLPKCSLQEHRRHAQVLHYCRMVCSHLPVREVRAPAGAANITRHGICVDAYVWISTHHRCIDASTQKRL